jgi:hypothetical protein
MEEWYAMVMAGVVLLCVAHSWTKDKGQMLVLSLSRSQHPESSSTLLDANGLALLDACNAVGFEVRRSGPHVRDPDG